MIASSKVLDALKGIGLNLYERKLWVSLLARGTSTAGELSNISNVPRSRAYDILQSLSEKGLVVVQTSRPISFVAVSPEDALERFKKKMEEETKVTVDRIDELKNSSVMRELNEIFTKGLKLISPEEMTGSLKGKYSVNRQFDSMFKSASNRINIVTTAEGLNEIHETHLGSLKKAKENGVVIKIATVANDRSEGAIKALGSIADIRHLDEKELALSGRFCIVDGKELVLGLTDPKVVHNTQDLAIWTKSEHAAGKVFEPLFKLVWNNSKPVS